MFDTFITRPQNSILSPFVFKYLGDKMPAAFKKPLQIGFFIYCTPLHTYNRPFMSSPKWKHGVFFCFCPLAACYTPSLFFSPFPSSLLHPSIYLPIYLIHLFSPYSPIPFIPPSRQTEKIKLKNRNKTKRQRRRRKKNENREEKRRRRREPDYVGVGFSCFFSRFSSNRHGGLYRAMASVDAIKCRCSFNSLLRERK